MSDEQLYSGITSASTSKIKEKKEDKTKELSKKRKELLPAGELLKAEFEKEIDKISRIDNVELDKLTDGFEIKAELLAQKRTAEILGSIQTRLMNVLRDNKDIPVKESKKES